MKQIWFFDIDGTLTRPVRWQRPHTCDDPMDALRLMDPCRVAQDEPNWTLVDHPPRLGRFSDVTILTGRADWSAHVTRAWLNRHGILCPLITRRPGDLRPSHVGKQDVLRAERVIHPLNDIFMVDDDEHLGPICAELGIRYIHPKEYE